jgi:hypothetical protein
MTTVWVYVDITKGVGDLNHLRIFASADAANKWLDENDPEGHGIRISGEGPVASGP